ncbi:hypothetical protein BJ742DRAFT_88935 [Cladochytrium replicatum]|nr:hypothetical protein BJ742DRAFT_88935 [Cladochytrium replicatum]
MPPHPHPPGSLSSGQSSHLKSISSHSQRRRNRASFLPSTIALLLASQLLILPWHTSASPIALSSHKSSHRLVPRQTTENGPVLLISTVDNTVCASTVSTGEEGDVVTEYTILLNQRIRFDIRGTYRKPTGNATGANLYLQSQRDPSQQVKLNDAVIALTPPDSYYYHNFSEVPPPIANQSPFQVALIWVFPSTTTGSESRLEGLQHEDSQPEAPTTSAAPSPTSSPVDIAGPVLFDTAPTCGETTAAISARIAGISVGIVLGVCLVIVGSTLTYLSRKMKQLQRWEEKGKFPVVGSGSHKDIAAAAAQSAQGGKAGFIERLYDLYSGWLDSRRKGGDEESGGTTVVGDANAPGIVGDESVTAASDVEDEDEASTVGEATESMQNTPLMTGVATAATTPGSTTLMDSSSPDVPPLPQLPSAALLAVPQPRHHPHRKRSPKRKAEKTWNFYEQNDDTTSSSTAAKAVQQVVPGPEQWGGHATTVTINGTKVRIISGGPPPRNTGGPSTWVPSAEKGKRYRVVVAHDAEREDEISLSRNDIVVVVETFEDHWALVSRLGSLNGEKKDASPSRVVEEEKAETNGSATGLGVPKVLWKSKSSETNGKAAANGKVPATTTATTKGEIGGKGKAREVVGLVPVYILSPAREDDVPR